MTINMIIIMNIIMIVMIITTRFRASPLTPLPSHRHCYISRLLLGQAAAQDSAHYQVLNFGGGDLDTLFEAQVVYIVVWWYKTG